MLLAVPALGGEASGAGSARRRLSSSSRSSATCFFTVSISAVSASFAALSLAHSVLIIAISSAVDWLWTSSKTWTIDLAASFNAHMPCKWPEFFATFSTMSKSFATLLPSSTRRSSCESRAVVRSAARSCLARQAASTKVSSGLSHSSASLSMTNWAFAAASPTYSPVVGGRLFFFFDTGVQGRLSHYASPQTPRMKRSKSGVAALFFSADLDLR